MIKYIVTSIMCGIGMFTILLFTKNSLNFTLLHCIALGFFWVLFFEIYDYVYDRIIQYFLGKK